MHEIVFATNNEHKIREIRQILGDRVRILSLKDIQCHEELPETHDSLEGNALEKANYVREHYSFDCFADDTGLEVDALQGRPGVYSARYAGEHCSFQDNVDKLLGEMKGIVDRKAQFRTVIAWVTQEGSRLFEGKVSGHISEEMMGEEGFGYDPIFVPEGDDRSFAQMTAEEKNAISHRRRAVDGFSQAFNSAQ